MGSILICIGLLIYVISPVDFVPGTFDDVIAFVILVFTAMQTFRRSKKR